MSTDEYQTDVYEYELATAGSMAEDIILTNVVSKEHRLKAKQWRENQTAALSPSRIQVPKRADQFAVVPVEQGRN